MRRLFVVVVLFSLAVMPGLATAQSPGSGMSLKTFIQKQIKEGQVLMLGNNIGALLGYPDGAPTRTGVVHAEETTDGLSHDYYLVIKRSSETEDAIPDSLLLLAQRKIIKVGVEGYWYRLQLDGALERAFIARVKFNENDQPIPGSGVKTDLDVHSPEVKTALKHELDFWLKGMYRKKKDARP